MWRPDLITGALAAAALGFVLSDWRESEGGAGLLFGAARPAAAAIAWPPAASRVTLEDGLAAAGDAPLLVYGRIEAPHVLAFERAAAASSLVAGALGNARVAVVDVGSELPDALRGAEVLRAVPAILALRRAADGSIDVLDAAEPLTGAVHEPVGLARELARMLAGERPLAALRAAAAAEPSAAASLALVARLEAAGLFDEAAEVHAAALAAERRPNGPMHADAALRRALRDHVRPEVADGEDGAVEAQLTVMSDPAALFRGWTLLASSAAAFADAGTTEEIGRTRWLRRLRRTARKAYKPCPEERLLPYASLLLERFALDREDLDSIDRSFCRVVARPIALEAPDRAAAARAAELFGQR
ncbi:MAG: hypothetical protein VX460_03580 [Planctomycetota bacterium]|nr:hypothetical protein [Planctomycetota bacterium]